MGAQKIKKVLDCAEVEAAEELLSNPFAAYLFIEYYRSTHGQEFLANTCMLRDEGVGLRDRADALLKHSLYELERQRTITKVARTLLMHINHQLK